MRRFSVALTAGLVIAGATLVPADATDARGTCAGETAPISSTAGAELGASVHCLVNAARLERGLLALQRESRLVQAAQGHADDMVARHYFDHTSPTGQTVGQRLTAAGYPNAWGGENIAQGQQTPRAVVDGLMKSTGHCRNMMRSEYRELGIGTNPGQGDVNYSAGMWVQNFGTRQGQSLPATDTSSYDVCPFGLSTVTAGTAPAVTATTAAATQTSAALRATVDPNGSFTSLRFELGASPSALTMRLERPGGAAADGTLREEAVTGLAAGTTYHFRVVATNTFGETAGPVESFTTGGAPAPSPTPTPTPVIQLPKITLPAITLPSLPVVLPAISEPKAAATARSVTVSSVRRQGSRVTMKVRVRGSGRGRASARVVGANGKVLGRGTFRVARVGTTTVRLTLTVAGRRVARRTPAKLRVSLPGGGTATASLRL